MAFAFCTLLVTLLVLLVFYLIKRYTYWKRRGIPTARGTVPFLGHMWPVFSVKMNYSELNRKLYDDYKGYSMIGYYKMTAPVLLVRDPYLAKTILTSRFSHFQTTGVKIHEREDPLMVKSPFFSTGDVWMTSRKRVASAFSNMKLKMLFEAVDGVCRKFQDFLDRRLRSNKRYEVDLKLLFSKFTGEVMANAGLGVEGHCFEDKPPPTAFDQIGNDLFREGFKEVLMLTAVFSPDLNQVLKVQMIPENVDKFFRELVARNFEARRKEPALRKDFFQMMVEYGDRMGKSIDEQTIASDMLTFFLDGFETSSIVLSFTGLLLAMHTDVQEKLRQEVTKVIAKHDGLTFEALKEMTYLEQVINESQRCYPAIGYLTRVCTEKCELRGSDGLTYLAEPGIEVIIPNHGYQLDPEYWTDPKIFDPDRFSEERRQPIEKLVHLPFGVGPRLCVGLKMGLLQMKSCLAYLISNYKLELSEKMQLPIKFSSLNFLTAPIGGYWVYISKI